MKYISNNFNRFVGGIFIIVGTTVGGGMLAIPVVSCLAGLIPSFLLISFVWLFMLLASFFLLDVNITVYSKDTNMISISEKTLGKWGKYISWVAYLFLLYSLNTAYISGSSILLSKGFFSLTSQHLSTWIGPLPLLLVFSIVVYLGTKSVDYFNRFLMIGLFLSYFILIFFLPDKITSSNYTHMDFSANLLSLPIIITSFGYQIVIPSLTTYMNHNKKLLKRMVIIGSLIPLLIYLLWEGLIFGTIPLYGQNGLLSIYIKQESINIALETFLNNPWISIFSQSFAFFAILTSFLGVSLSLFDFLKDGLKIKRKQLERPIVYIFTFIPPLFFMYSFENVFIAALDFAAIFVLILLVIIPALMRWKLKRGFFSSVPGRLIILTVIIIACSIIVLDILNKFSDFNFSINKYVSS